MKFHLPSLITIVALFIVSCSTGQDKKALPKPFKFEIKIQVLNQTELDTSFWKINRQLEKKNPKLFDLSLSMSDTTNPNYVTHLLKRYRNTYRGQTSYRDKNPFYCVASGDTAKLGTFLNNPEYKNFFSTNTSFAYAATSKNKSCLDLYALGSKSITFTTTDIDSVFLHHEYTGAVIGVRIKVEAQQRLKAFTQEVMNQEVAFLMNGLVYCTATITGTLDRYFQLRPELTREEVSAMLKAAQGD